jgi:hypothetical protein
VHGLKKKKKKERKSLKKKKKKERKSLKKKFMM